MKKFIATRINEVDSLPLDCFSISHFNSGIIGYLLSFWILSFFMSALSAVFLSFLVTTVGGLTWEFIENIWLVEAKRNHRPDKPINCLVDILLVFLGGFLGCICYNTDWIFKLTLIGGLLLAYAITRIWTEKNSKK